jgi:formylglycine-generating enzyme required for sulfatase activity
MSLVLGHLPHSKKRSMRFLFAFGLLAVMALAFRAGPLAMDTFIVRSVAAASSEIGHHAGDVFRDCPDCPEMVVIPSGQFTMGSPLSEHGRFDSEGPQHNVSVRPLAFGRHLVTVEEFSVFVRETGHEIGACDWPSGTNWQSSGFVPKDPVVCISWNDAQAYIAWLNGKVHSSGHGIAGDSGPYRLPSEAEWEYTARAGTETARWWGEAIGAGNADCNGCGSPWDNKQIAPVGSFAANPFGVFDMLGNVWQWTEDCWNESYLGAPNDGNAWLSGDCGKRVLRGGSWSNLPKFVRAAARNRDEAGNRSHDYASYVGFRVVRNLP